MGRFVSVFGVLVWMWLARGLGVLMSTCPAWGPEVSFEFGVLVGAGLPWAVGPTKDRLCFRLAVMCGHCWLWDLGPWWRHGVLEGLGFEGSCCGSICFGVPGADMGGICSGWQVRLDSCLGIGALMQAGLVVEWGSALRLEA